MTDRDFAGQMAALADNLAEIGALTLITWACSFQHIADDEVVLMLADAEWLSAYDAVQREVDERGLRVAFEQIYKQERARVEADPDFRAYRRQIKRTFN